MYIDMYLYFSFALETVSENYAYTLIHYIYTKKIIICRKRVIRVNILKIKNIYILGPCYRCNGPRENYRELGRKTDGPRG